MRLVIRILKFPLAYLGEDGLFKFRIGVPAIVIGTNRFSTRSDFITIGDNEKKSSHSAAFFSGHRAVDTPHCCRCTLLLSDQKLWCKLHTLKHERTFVQSKQISSNKVAFKYKDKPETCR